MAIPGDQWKVAKFYDGPAFEVEMRRLPEEFPVEMAITSRWLERFAPQPPAIAVEVGVGGGYYSELLAKKSCDIHLVDVSQRLLDAVANKLRAAGLGSRIRGAHHESATALRSFVDASADLVLLLGPLYHLLTQEDRERAVAEAARVLKPGGILFAAGINRLAYLRSRFQRELPPVEGLVEFHRQYMRDGNLDPEHAPPIGYAHLTTEPEFRALFEEHFHEAAFIGVESFTSATQASLNRMSPAEAEHWLELVQATATWVEGIGQSDHYLFIGRRKL